MQSPNQAIAFAQICEIRLSRAKVKQPKANLKGGDFGSRSGKAKDEYEQAQRQTASVMRVPRNRARMPNGAPIRNAYESFCTTEVFQP